MQVLRLVQRFVNSIIQANWIFVFYNFALIMLIGGIAACLLLAIAFSGQTVQAVQGWLLSPGPTRVAREATPHVNPFKTLFPTAGPSPTVVVSRPKTSQLCVPDQDASKYIGKETCVQGYVTQTYQTDAGFFIEFTDPGNGFLVVSLDKSWENLAGKCIAVRGSVLQFKGRPYIILQNDELLACEQ